MVLLEKLNWNQTIYAYNQSQAVEMEEELTTFDQTHFIPEVYIDTYYTHFTGDRIEDELLKFTLDSLHDTYKDGKITGERLLDIGSGPVCHSLYAPSKWFKELVLSDKAEENLQLLRRWKAGDVKYQKAVFQYMIDANGSQEDWIDCNKRLASQVREIVAFDLRKGNPCSGTSLEGVLFDAAQLILCLHGTVFTHEEYTACLQSFSSFLKPGGHIFVVAILDLPSYPVGGFRFKTFYTTKEKLQTIYQECGYEIISWKQQHLTTFDCEIFAMVAKKM